MRATCGLPLCPMYNKKVHYDESTPLAKPGGPGGIRVRPPTRHALCGAAESTTTYLYYESTTTDPFWAGSINT